MKTTIDGLEITPAIITVLKEWYVNDNAPAEFVKWLTFVEDCLVRLLICRDIIDKEKIKESLYYILYIKDEFQKFDLKPEGGEQ
jgi:hypothetical protein